MADKPGKAVELIAYDARHLEATLAFLRKWNLDHPELASAELLKWQQGRRWLALFKGEIVGHMAQIPQVFADRGTNIALGWGATLVLDTTDPLVQIFAGTALLDKLTKESNLPFAAVGVVPEIEETHKRRGYAVRRDAVSMYARFLNPVTALRYIDKPAWWSLPLRVVNLLRRPRRGRHAGEISRIESFEPGWDDAWARCLAGQYECYGARTAEFLNHKIGQPHKSYESCIYTGESGELEGYIVYREAVNRVKNIRLLKICDLVGTEAAKPALLARAVSAAREAKVDGIVALSSNRDAGIFGQAGMWIKKPYPVVLPPEIGGAPHISFFDSDLDDLW